MNSNSTGFRRILGKRLLIGEEEESEVEIVEPRILLDEILKPD
jgi:hypothetical protein